MWRVNSSSTPFNVTGPISVKDNESSGADSTTCSLTTTSPGRA
jgi:hypothetical protein